MGLEQQGEALLKGAEGERLKKLSATADAQAVGKMVDPEAIKSAAARGDTQALKNMLAQVLSTGEGQRLAAQLGGILGKK